MARTSKVINTKPHMSKDDGECSNSNNTNAYTLENALKQPV